MKTLKERFDEKWIPVPESGCWLWTATCYPSGYGVIGVGSRTDGSRTNVAAHRLSYELHVGDIPQDICVLHKCDTPQCVNPNHLFLGTKQDNNKDKLAKNRQAKGARMNRGHLTESDVQAIRQMKQANPSFSCKQIGQTFNVARNTISLILQGKRWGHVA